MTHRHSFPAAWTCPPWTLALFAAALLTLTPALRADGPAFTNIAKDSGIEALVAQKYEQVPKWLLFGMEMVDLDGDGRLDLFFGAHGHGGGVAALNDGKGHFSLAKGAWPDSEIFLAYDLDEDGKIDLAMNEGDGQTCWWLNRSKPGQLEFAKTKLMPPTGQCRQNAIIDIDRDGKADWIGGAPPGVQFMLGDGKGSFKAGGNSLAIPGTGHQGEECVTPVDIDGDGKVELLVEWGHYSNGKGNFLLYKETEPGKWTNIAKEAGLPATGISVKCIGDFNQDGSPDLLVLEGLQNLEVYLNDGKGHFQKKEGAVTGANVKAQYQSWGMGVMTDFDNDGIPDVMVLGRSFMRVLRGTGGGNFVCMNKEWGLPLTGHGDSGLCFGDIDSDGKLDIMAFLTAGYDPPVKVGVFHNDLPAKNWLRVRPTGLAGNRGAAGAKIRVYESQGLGDPKKLLWYEPIVIYGRQQSQSYYGLGQTERHFGLGERAQVDVSVEFYPSGKKVEKKGVAANRIVTVNEESGTMEEKELK